MASSTTDLDRSTINNNLHRFSKDWRQTINQWRKENTKHTESSYAQSFWTEFLGCFGVNTARRAFFEQQAKRGRTGTSGYIDLFWSGVMIGEAKSLGKNLIAAEDQARDYLAHISDAEFPRYILCTDFETFHLTKIETGARIEFTIDELPDYQDQLAFLAGREEVDHREQKQASIKASKIMAELFNAMVGEEVDVEVADEAPTYTDEEDNKVQRTSMWLTRLLFLMFGDDAGLWEADLFHRFMAQETNPDNFGAQMSALFKVLNTHEDDRRNVPGLLGKFPYVNGSLFNDALEPEFFTPDMYEAVRNACGFQWSRISPAIFGALFQLVKSKEARRADGEHYTSEANILKVLRPLFLDDLRKEADRLVRNKTTKVKELEEYLDKLTRITFCDPACGCGNFLVVAYRELRAIETDIIARLHEFPSYSATSLDVMFEQRLSIDQFHGFELNWWPARIAELAMFLVDHQANQELAKRIGNAIVRLPIEISAHIRHENALHLDWKSLLPNTEKTYIFGNPPFIGQHTKTKEQKADMKAVWGKNYNGYLDYVTAWHAKALDTLRHRPGEFAYVTTNSICQGQPVPALFQPLYDAGWDIKFAHRTFAWDSEAPGKASVHCIIVGFTRDHSTEQQVWEYPDVKGEAHPVKLKKRVNAYLVEDDNRTLVRKRSKPLSQEVPSARFGSKPTDGGNLIVEANEYDNVQADPVAAKYLRPFRMGKELVRGLDRWCLWMADDFDPADVNRSPVLKERIERVRSKRLGSTKKATRESARTPHLFQENHQPNQAYVAIPRVVSETRNYYTASHLTPDVIAGDKVYTAIDPDGLLFGLISSSMFIVWQKAIGGRLESRLNFANTLTWNTFPVPELDDTTRKAIIAAGKGVQAARDLHPERSLADAYNPLAMAPELIRAHDILDEVVDKAMGAENRLDSTELRLELLFDNYAIMSQRCR